MRTYQVNVNGRMYAVEIDDLNASPITVRVNGRTFSVKLSEQATASQPASSRPVSSLEAAVEIHEPYVPVMTSTFVDTIDELSAESTERTAVPPAASEDLEGVVAPMPGRVIDIVVKVGDQVKQGDTLCNLEAMKMKSPIRSTVDGVITQILISEGQNVNSGDTLFTVG